MEKGRRIELSAQSYALEVLNLEKRFGETENQTVALKDVSFTVGHGEFVCIVGPSGCGKTTLFKCLSGLMRPTRGLSKVNGEKVTAPRKEISMVFQEYTRSLLPWLTNIQNVMLPLKNKITDRVERRKVAQTALESVGLGDSISKYPWQLSGGMQQRVAIARGLAYQPDILLLDEPFASVDAQTRAELEDLVLLLRERYDVTLLLITHDIDEAVYLADRIVVLSQRPTEVMDVVDVPLGKERSQLHTRSSREFAEIRGRVAAMIASQQLNKQKVGK